MTIDPSPTLAEFLPRYKADDNEWWRLQCGDHQNLFDEANDERERLRHALETIAAGDLDWGPMTENYARRILDA